MNDLASTTLTAGMYYSACLVLAARLVETMRTVRKAVTSHWLRGSEQGTVNRQSKRQRRLACLHSLRS